MAVDATRAIGDLRTLAKLSWARLRLYIKCTFLHLLGQVMQNGFPRYSSSAKLGELGVRIVSRVVSDGFGWLFKRNHQEHDFGIDGQIELVTKQGAVTGQMLGVQIKCGKSFLKEQNKWGIVYRGEQKHFNYLVNYPLPVIICVCDPDTEVCYWVRFRPEETEPTEVGWKITLPFENILSTAQNALQRIVGPIRDGISELESYWKVNKMISDTSVIYYVLDRLDVYTRETALPRAFFDRLRATKQIASECQGKVELMFSGYDKDKRELFEIPEVRTYVAQLAKVLPDLLYFARTEQPTHGLRMFGLCQVSVNWVKGRSTRKVTRKVTFDAHQMLDILMRHTPYLNELTEWVGMPLEEEKRVYYNIVKCLGLPVPEDTV